MPQPDDPVGSSAPLLCRDLQPSGTQSFQQQGTVEWTNVVNGSVGFTVNTLSRLSKAGVETLTIYAARWIFCQAKLGTLGEIRLQGALQRIEPFPSLSQALWFGFGLKHIVRSMQDSKEGLSCIGICACLTEEFSSEVSAKIMSELFLLYKPPQELTPALRQWLCLIEACAGILASTEFGLILHGLTRVYFRQGSTNLRGCASPSRIALVLKSLFDVSTGQLDRVKLSGGTDCAWIAAVGHWLLDLSVRVEDSSGNVIYQPASSHSIATQDAQVILLYNEQSSEAYQLIGRHYVIPSGSALIHSEVQEEAPYLSHGRVKWDSCLVDIFGSPMKQLLTTLSITTGHCLGSVARIFAALMSEGKGTPDPDLKHMYRVGTPPATPSSFGRGFFLTARRLLPELENANHLLGMMEQSLDHSYTEAVKEYCESMASLQQFCACSACSNSSEPVDPSHEAFCLCRLIETMCNLIRLMSYCTVPDNATLLPTVTGLERMYWQSRKKRKTTGNGGDDVYTSLVTCWPVSCKLDIAACLFTGRKHEWGERGTGIDSASALYTNGLCFYFNTLCVMSSDPERACTINIVPGSIQWNDFVYEQVHDIRERHATEEADAPYSSVSTTAITNYDTLANSASSNMNGELIVEEGLVGRRTLIARYRISSSQHVGYFSVGVRFIWYRLSSVFSAASCVGKDCRSLNGFKCILVEGEGMLHASEAFQPGQAPVLRVLCSQPLAIWVALAQGNIQPVDGTQPRRALRVLSKLQGNQCVRCCVVNTMQDAEDYLLYVCLITSA